MRLVGIEPSCAVITVLPDERVEGDEQFLVRVVITENMPIEVPPAAIVTITDTSKSDLILHCMSTCSSAH